MPVNVQSTGCLRESRAQAGQAPRATRHQVPCRVEPLLTASSNVFERPQDRNACNGWRLSDIKVVFP